MNLDRRPANEELRAQRQARAAAAARFLAVNSRPPGCSPRPCPCPGSPTVQRFSIRYFYPRRGSRRALGPSRLSCLLAALPRSPLAFIQCSRGTRPPPRSPHLPRPHHPAASICSGEAILGKAPPCSGPVSPWALQTGTCYQLHGDPVKSWV